MNFNISNIKNKSLPEEMIKDLEIKMKDAAANLEFEEAAKLRYNKKIRT